MRRLLFWEFPRASWQYDIVVALILAFIFLTPREIFKDQPRAAQVVQIPSDSSANVFWIEPHLLPEDAAQQRLKAAELVKARTGKNLQVYRIEPIANSEEEVMGYMAYTRP
jgi:hypothetical protein